MIKYVFFDFNGTIIDDVDLCLDLLNDILREQNKKEVSLEEYKNIFTFPIRKYYELAGVDFNIESYENLAVKFINKYQPASYECNLYPGIKDVVDFLHSKGIKCVILSASEINNLRDQCQKFNIDKLFDDILGIDDIHAASKVGIAKKYFELNKIKPGEAIFIGDTLHDEEVASSLGVKSLLVPNGHQSLEVLEGGHSQILSDIRCLKNDYENIFKID